MSTCILQTGSMGMGGSPGEWIPGSAGTFPPKVPSEARDPYRYKALNTRVPAKETFRPEIVVTVGAPHPLRGIRGFTNSASEINRLPLDRAERIQHAFRHRRMRVDGEHKVVHGAFELQNRDGFGDQLRCQWP